jgi:hypothetical protein
LGAHSAKRDLKVFKRLQKHEIEDVERRAQFRLGKDLESVREFETAFGKRLHRESRESDLRLQNKLDENDTVLRGHKQTLEQRLDEARARFQDKIKNMQRKAELRVSRRQREADELQVCPILFSGEFIMSFLQLICLVDLCRRPILKLWKMPNLVPPLVCRPTSPRLNCAATLLVRPAKHRFVSFFCVFSFVFMF